MIKITQSKPYNTPSNYQTNYHKKKHQQNHQNQFALNKKIIYIYRKNTSDKYNQQKKKHTKHPKPYQILIPDNIAPRRHPATIKLSNLNIKKHKKQNKKANA